MHVKNLQVGYLMTNCYIIADEKTLDCAVVDPGGDAAMIEDYLEEHHLRCQGILLTHGHFDHCMGVRDLLEAVDVPLFMNKKDVDPKNDIGNDTFVFVPPENTCYVEHGSRFDVGSLHFEVIGCPGHTPGGVTYKIEDCLFTGDTLFRRSIGRSDFPASDGKALQRSLQRLLALRDDYEVFPGHGDMTSLEYERHFNPWL